jgi:hypothetical protein
MKDIKELTVQLVKIFPVDYIPYTHLFRPDFIAHMKKKYLFTKHQMPFEYIPKDTPNLLIFLNGEYLCGEKRMIINRLNFEDRKIILEAMASSEVSGEIFSAIAEDIKTFDPTNRFDPSDASFESEKTSCILSLDVHYMSIYSEKMKTFINSSFAPLLEHKYFEIRPKRMRFEVEFEPDINLAKEERITLAPKDLTIEPRLGQRLNTKMFYSESPFDSDTHLKLLEEFEKIFGS